MSPERRKELEYNLFSEEDIVALILKIGRFHERHEEPLVLEYADVDEQGNIAEVVSGLMPTYRLDKRTVTVLAPNVSEAPVNMAITDILGESDAPKLLVSRVLRLDPAQVSRIDYRSSLSVEYSEFPANSEGKPIVRTKWRDDTPTPVLRFRPFTQGDYDDMVTTLDAGL